MLHNAVGVGQRTSEVITKSHHGHYTQKSFSVINGHRHISHKTEHTTLRIMQPRESLTCNCTAKDSYLTNGKQTGPNGDLTAPYNSTRLHSKQTRDLPELSTTAVPCTDYTLCLRISRSEFSFSQSKSSSQRYFCLVRHINTVSSSGVAHQNGCLGSMATCMARRGNGSVTF